jgi:hypothetical protein
VQKSNRAMLIAAWWKHLPIHGIEQAPHARHESEVDYMRRVPSLLPAKSAIHTLPCLSKAMPCGLTMTPLPKFASTAPVFRSNLKMGSNGELTSVASD